MEQKSYLKKASLLLISLFLSFSFFSCKSTPKKETTEIENNVVEEKNDVEEDKSPENQTIEENTYSESDFSEEENYDTDDVEVLDDFDEVEEVEKEPVVLSRYLLGIGIQTPQQLATFFLAQNPDFTTDYIEYFAGLYVSEAKTEHINSDVAFAQMCLETGFLRFGGLVQPEWHNYCGLGAMDAEHPGCIFETEQLGVRAHIQHLQAYATTEEISLINELIDPRYSWVHKTKFAETIKGLTGTWATDPNYSIKLENILCRMEEMLNE